MINSFKLKTHLKQGVTPLPRTSPPAPKDKPIEVKYEPKNTLAFWNGLAKRDNIGDNDTRFLAFQLPNNSWIFEWFNGSAETRTIFDFLRYHLQIAPNDSKVHLTITGYNEPDFIVQEEIIQLDNKKKSNGSKIKDDLKRGTDLRKRELLKVIVQNV